MDNNLILISAKDNVAIALKDLKCCEKYTINNIEIELKNDIPFGHKIAICNINAGENIIKYGYAIGCAKCSISIGEHIHTHNLKTNLDGILSYSYKPTDTFDTSNKEAFFDGYVRKNGKVGIRNELWIIPTVGCVNNTAKILEKQANEKYKDLIDGVFAYTHNMGCSQLGTDHKTTQQILKGLAENPNAGGVLILSLGCENNNLEEFLPILGDYDKDRIKFLATQDFEDEYEKSMELLEQLVQNMKHMKREKVSAKNLTIGFKCGGSDAFSGITANPLCGAINDKVIACGGSTILTEVPEMFGAETILMARAKDKEVFSNIVDLINDYKNYFTKYNQTIYENPSPGNKKGGISSLEEKSLGCTQKSGNTPVVGVLNYGDAIQNNGLNLLIGSGNDQVSCTNLVASGVQMVLFTTGRGNPFGSPVPTVKISSNTSLANKKPHWIDFNAGEILEGSSLENISENFFNYLLDVASGKTLTNNEKYGYKEISIFRDGVIL